MDDDLARERSHLTEMLTIYEALASAMERRREVFELVTGSSDRDQALGRLRELLDIEEAPARAVLDAQLLRFTERDRARIVEERDRMRRRLTDGD